MDLRGRILRHAGADDMHAPMKLGGHLNLHLAGAAQQDDAGDGHCGDTVTLLKMLKGIFHTRNVYAITPALQWLHLRKGIFVMPLHPSFITTGLDLPGYRVVRSLGLVRGIVVRSRSVFGTIGASLQTLVGGDITLYTNLCERTRQDALLRMEEHAIAMGANAVIAFRYDANEVMQGVTEVLAYGTAVVVEALPQEAI